MGGAMDSAMDGARDGAMNQETARAELARLRASIDNLDAALVHLLAERFRCTEEVGRLKARAGLPRPTPRARRSRSRGCGPCRSRRASTPSLPRSS